MADLIGQKLGQYEIIGKLGSGGVATVYRARQVLAQRDVAVKVVESKLAGNPEFIERFEREAHTIATLDHPHILKLFDIGLQGDLVYLVMALLLGGSLADLLLQGPLAAQQVSQTLDQLASALDYAHSKGLVHGDLKPRNVLFDETGAAYLADFGNAKLLNETTVLTASSMPMGTPAYMSPEQWRGQALDARSDIYALGIMLFEMLSGRLPFNAGTPRSMMYIHLNELPPPITSLRPDLPLTIEQIVNKALAKDPEQRFQSAGALTSAFKFALTDVTPSKIGSHTPSKHSPPEAIPVADMTAPFPADHVRSRARLLQSGIIALGAVVLIATLGILAVILTSGGEKNVPTEAHPLFATVASAQVAALAPIHTSTSTQMPTLAPIYASTSTQMPTPTPTLIVPTPMPTSTQYVRPSPVPSTAVALVPSIPQDRSQTPRDAVLLQDGRGLTNNTLMRNGEFQVEGYCQNNRASVDYYDWYCRDSGYKLSAADFDEICQRTYNLSGAFAVQDGSSSQPSYRWRCYAFSTNSKSQGNEEGSSSIASRICSSSPPSRLSIGNVGYVIPEEGASNLNKYPRKSGNNNRVVDILQPGERFTVINGPQCGDGLAWWQVRYHKNSFVGWLAEGEGNTYWIAPR